MSNTSNTPAALPSVATTTDKVLLATNTLEQLTKAFASPGKESAITAVKAALVAAGSVVAYNNWAAGEVIVAAIGALVAVASWGYMQWDDWRASNAVKAAGTDATLNAKLAAAAGAVEAAQKGGVK